MLDLVYEARENIIDQKLGLRRTKSTPGLMPRPGNNWQKDNTKKQWGTMRNVLSSRSRMDRVVADIVFDFQREAAPVERPRATPSGGFQYL